MALNLITSIYKCLRASSTYAACDLSILPKGQINKQPITWNETLNRWDYNNTLTVQDIQPPPNFANYSGIKFIRTSTYASTGAIPFTNTSYNFGTAFATLNTSNGTITFTRAVTCLVTFIGRFDLSCGGFALINGTSPSQGKILQYDVNTGSNFSVSETFNFNVNDTLTYNVTTVVNSGLVNGYHYAIELLAFN